MADSRGVFDYFDGIRVRVELCDREPSSEPTKVWLLEMGPFSNTDWSLDDLAADLRPIFEGTSHMLSQTKKAVHWGASGGWGEVALVVSTAFATKLTDHLVGSTLATLASRRANRREVMSGESVDLRVAAGRRAIVISYQGVDYDALTLVRDTHEAHVSELVFRHSVTGTEYLVKIDSKLSLKTVQRSAKTDP